MDITDVVNSNTLPSANNLGKNELKKDDFLRLMLTQMKHQDPFDPVDNQQMLSQLAQFSSLEQMANINESISSGNSSQNFADATRLLGKSITYLERNNEGETSQATSTVQSITKTSEGPQVTLANGRLLNMADVISVREPIQNQ